MEIKIELKIEIEIVLPYKSEKLCKAIRIPETLSPQVVVPRTSESAAVATNALCEKR